MGDKASSELSTGRIALDATLGGVAEAIAGSMFRAVAARAELTEILRRDDATLMIEPWIRYGGRVFIFKGNGANLLQNLSEG